MPSLSSRRSFVAGSLALPAVSSLRAAQEPPREPVLSYRTLGKTGLKVTTLGFGCMITSDPTVIQRGADYGINYFDTARGYQSGNNERMVGAALKGRRDKVYISTKSAALTRQGALEHLDTSLKELGTDYIDFWYLHGKDSPAEFTDDLREAQRIAKQAGKIRFAGVSIHETNPAMAREVLKNHHFDVLLVVYNFMNGPERAAFMKTIHDAGIGLIAMKVMAGGPRHRDATPRSRKVLSRPGASLAALKWVIRNPQFSTTIPSMTDIDQLEENMQAMAAPFAGGDEKLLASRAEEIRDTYCRSCGACSGQCAQGVPVREALRSVMYADGYGQFALGREHFRTLPAAAQAARCGDCAECTVNCPNGVKVAQRLALAQHWFA